ncbi:helix-turn-helix domain-containing protein [Halalkalibacter urbisdiaboli]|uniref:helix-turn-helix domain-containing protein n=1 Tax=Halalkalibacter urbisdiaboli TaxID=1960589 RepID=UPI000B44FDCB|nr:AraC family transcriptional regulator [Halalkalibacter urbisdiaboli]
MNRKELLNKNLSIQSEYETDFSKKSTQLNQLLTTSIVTGNMELFHQVKNEAEQIKDIQVILDEQLEVQKLYVASTVASFVRLAIKQGLPKDIAESAKREFFLNIAHCLNKDKLEEYYFKIVEELIVGINKYSLENYSPIVKMAIEYIHNNKFRFIYAKDVSSAIRVNRSYLSKIFKLETGQSVTDYIHHVKMEFAIELMESNFYKFNEVSELLGYANYSYFSKVFKKIYNKTPFEYMKKLDC